MSTTKPLARLETRVKPEVKKALRVYCAERGLTIQECVEKAVSELCKPSKKDEANAS